VLSAAPRDASWFAKPNVSSFKVVHANNGDDFAVCMPVPLCDSPRWEDSREVPPNVRCRRRSCAKAFAAADHETTGLESS
jgi:hypothetical protein